MMRIYVCQNCGRTRIISKLLKAKCVVCDHEMVECHVPYSEWVDLSIKEREAVIIRYMEKLE